MRRGRIRLAWGAASLLACHPAPVESVAAEPLGELLAREVAAQLSLPAFIAYVAAAATFAATLVGIRLLLVSLWRLGFDGERRLTLLVPIAEVLSVVAVLVWLIARWLRLSPHLLVVFFPLGTLGSLWVFAGHVRNLSAGALLVLTRRIRQGDRIQVRGHSGVVREVGLGRTLLRRSDGSRVYVPNQDLLASTLTVARERLTEPIEVVVPMSESDGASLLETARRLALVSPYRALGTPIDVRWDHPRGVLHVHLHAWSEGAARLATKALRNALVEARSRLSQRRDGSPAVPER